MLALGDRGAVVDLFREAERAVEEDDPEPVAGDLAELGEDLGRGRAVGDDDDLVVVVGRGLDDAADAVGDEDDLLEPDFAAVPGGRDDDADRGPPLELGDELVDAGVVEVALDPRRQPDPLAVGLKRPGPGFERPGLRRFAAAGGRGREHPPVVEDPRHVGDLPRPLGHPQDQVPVLGALELGVEAADLLDQRAAQDAEVAGVHLGPEPLRRPVGLEERPRVAPAPRRSCLRRCRRSRPRGRPAAPPRRARARRGAACRRGRGGRRTRRRAIASASLEAATMPPFCSRRETRIRPSSRAAPSSDLQDLRVGRAVVDEAELPVAEALAADRVEHRLEDSRRGFVERRQDREAGGGQPAQPLPLRRCESLRARRPGSFTRLTR